MAKALTPLLAELPIYADLVYVRTSKNKDLIILPIQVHNSGATESGASIPSDNRTGT